MKDRVRRGGLLSLVLIGLLLLTSCWNRKELNDMAIVVGIGIDKGTKAAYRITAQVVEPGEIAPRQGGGSRAPVVSYAAEGETVFEAIRKMTSISPRKMYLAHIRILVIAEELAKEGIGPSLDFFSRDHEVRSDFFVLLARDAKANDVLETMTPLEKIPADKMYKSLETSEKVWAPTHAVTLDELISNMTAEGIQPVLTGIKIVGDTESGKKKDNVEVITPPTRLETAYIAVFKKDKLIGWLNEQESKGYNYILNHVSNTVGNIPCPQGGTVVVELFRAKPSVKAVMKNNKPAIQVKVKVESNIAEMRCNADVLKPEVLEELEQAHQKFTTSVIRAGVVKAQKLHSDILGFGETIYRTMPGVWSEVKDNWNDEHFPALDVEISVEVALRRTGTTSNSYTRDFEGMP